MFGAARNGACKSARFDCRFVIKGERSLALRARPGKIGRSEPMRANRIGRLGPSEPSLNPNCAVTNARKEMNISSFLMAQRMRITHGKIASRRYARSFRPLSLTATCAGRPDSGQSRTCVTSATIPIYFNEILPISVADGRPACRIGRGCRKVKRTLLEPCVCHLAASQHRNYCDAQQCTMFISTMRPPNKG